MKRLGGGSSRRRTGAPDQKKPRRATKMGGRSTLRVKLAPPANPLTGEGVKMRLKEHLMEECNLHTIVRLPNSVFKPYASIGTNLLFFEKGTPTKDV
jgi:type I restriction enzyme M protein